MNAKSFAPRHVVRNVVPWVMTLLLVAGFVLLWVWSAGREGRAARDLPAPERQALCLRTVETLGSVCAGPAADSLSAYCREQAAIVIQLDECDTTCRDLARRHLSYPTR